MAFDLTSVLKDVPEVGTGREQIEYLRLDQLVSDANNFYQLSKIDDLAANIQLCGLQQPIRVRRCADGSDRYTIVSGHRRRAAIELLAADEPEKWKEVPCIVEQDEVSPALQQLRLIYANANTRVMLPAEISEQAVQVEKLLYQLKEEGYSFPGRMRDHVAEAVSVSKSKLSRLKVIRDGLDAVWKPAFQKGEIGESVAYALARMSSAHQGSVYAMHGSSAKSLTEEALQVYEQRMKDIDSVTCKHNATGICVNAREMRDKCCKDRWSDPCYSRCCYDCNSLQTCSKSCRNAELKKKELKITAKKAEAEAGIRQAEKDELKKALIRNVYLRVGEARVDAGRTPEDVFAAQKRFVTASVLSDFEALETGKKAVSGATPLPFGYSCDVSSVQAMIAVADCLGCSLDWLLGRTDAKDVARQEQPVPTVGTMWHPISEEPPTGRRLVWCDATGWTDQAEYCGGQRISSASTIPWEEARYWAYLPEECE